MTTPPSLLPLPWEERDVVRGSFDSLIRSRTQTVFLLLGNKPSLSQEEGERALIIELRRQHQVVWRGVLLQRRSTAVPIGTAPNV